MITVDDANSRLYLSRVLAILSSIVQRSLGGTDRAYALRVCLELLRLRSKCTDTDTGTIAAEVIQ
mgnify:CR=1 FL=1